MTKPLKVRPNKVESAPEFGNALEVETPGDGRPDRELNREAGGGDARETDAADEERPYEFENSENGEDIDDVDVAGRLAAMPVDARYEEIKRGEIHIAELQK